ncbi:hypothetical protein HYX14_03745 [Candidatus Woesearchaeota archaeon]|nr:hypothetical protein [Candidatus Woesearchaeota archaeon]
MPPRKISALAGMLAAMMSCSSGEEGKYGHYPELPRGVYGSPAPVISEKNSPDTITEQNISIASLEREPERDEQISTTDFLAEKVRSYKMNDEWFNPDKDMECDLGIRIIGEPTPIDLEKLITFFGRHRQRAFVQHFKELGIQYLVFLSDEDKKAVDYAGLAMKGEKEIRLGSSFIDAVLLHELVHFDLWHREKSEYFFAGWFVVWNSAAGQYDKIITKQKRGFIDVRSYQDGTQGARFGYVLPYGGKDFQEDVATFVAQTVTQPELFQLVQDSFQIYDRKLQLLQGAGYISFEERLQALVYLNLAEVSRMPKDGTAGL